MRELTINLLPKQKEAWNLLADPNITELLYGGSAGSGKSDLGCTWVIANALAYPETRWLIGRKTIALLKQSTMKTFRNVAKRLGLTDKDWHWPGNSNEITFSNGSEVVLRHLFKYPSDPDYDSLGGLELTGAYVDEASEIEEKAYSVIKSRIGRYKNAEYGIKGKILMTCNPSKNFLYPQFYEASKQGKLPSFREFIAALPKDNKFLTQDYLDTLLQLPKNSRERLYYGNWEYDDDPTALIPYDKILALFNNAHIPSGDKWITVDPAYTGGDSTVILVWDGFRIIDYHHYSGPLVSNEQTIDHIRTFTSKHQVPFTNITIDVGGGYGNAIWEAFKGSNRFNGGSASPTKEYSNLRTHCFYKLADMINKNEIYFQCGDTEVELRITRELEQLKRDKVDQDGKLFVVSKGVMKDGLGGKSPDFLDALSMRMVQTLIKTTPPLFQFYVREI